jgi:hypothetical protein|tara:strand:+ start:121 stop:396 length:276 start_codon:yes stop_codon:yes gene_type:complete
MKTMNQKGMTVELKLNLELGGADLQVHDLQLDKDYETKDLPSNIVAAVHNEIQSWLQDLGFSVEITTVRVSKRGEDITNDVVFTKSNKERG